MSNRIKNLAKKYVKSSEEGVDLSRMLDKVSAIVALSAGMSENNKLNKAISWGTLAVSLGTAAKSIYDFVQKSNKPVEYIIKIHESDDIFGVAEDWFMESLPEDKQLSVYAHSVREFSDDMEVPDPSSERNQQKMGLSYSFDGDITHEMEVDGHIVEVNASTPDQSSSSQSGGGSSMLKLRTIYIKCPSLKARDAVLDELERLTQKVGEQPNRLFVSTNWGGFRIASATPNRDIDTVFLKDGQMERILDYIDSFQKNKDAFEKAGIPYRMGILLEGAPGSGKTSTATAIGTKLNMDIYVISISSVDSDDTLGSCFERIPPNSLVVLEDIDIAHSVKDRDNDLGVTMSGMLNVLDGFQSPPGVITIMTTNRLDVLDPAIIRPGRVDITENLSCLDNKQLSNLCKYFMGHTPSNLPDIKPSDGISSAEIVGVFRNHLPNFHEAEKDIVTFVTQKVFTKAT